MEDDEGSCSDEEANDSKVADIESYDEVAAKAVDKDYDKQMKKLWYLCCNDVCIAEHKGETYNGSICKTTDCDCCNDGCKVHLFTNIGSEVVEYEPP